MQLIKDLCDVLTTSNKPIKIIGIVPQSGEEDFIIHEEGDTLEIGLTKQIYFRIFKESHEVFHTHHEDRLRIDSLSHSNMEELYYMTLGYLITTNEHSTIIALHEELVERLGNHEYDLEIVSCFLTCRMKRINKSSMLWHFVKKLTMIRLSKDSDVSQFLCRALVSCELHFANYYGNNYLQWLIVLCKSKEVELNEFQNMLIDLCRKHLLDSSLWGTLKMAFNPDKVLIEYVTLVYYNSLTGESLLKKFPRVDYNDTVVTLFEWLLRLYCQYKTPFLVLIESTNSLTILDEFGKMLNKSTLKSTTDLKDKLLKRKQQILSTQ